MADPGSDRPWSPLAPGGRWSLTLVDLCGLAAALQLAGALARPLPWAAQGVVLAAGFLIPRRAAAEPGFRRRWEGQLERMAIVAVFCAALFRLWLGVPWSTLLFAPLWVACGLLAESWPWLRAALRAAWRLGPPLRAAAAALVSLARRQRWDIPAGMAGVAALGCFLAGRFVPGFWSTGAPRAQLVAAAWIAAALAVQAVLLRSGRRRADPIAEHLRGLALAAAGVFLLRGILRFTLHGTGDARWYAMVLADVIRQTRAGIFPVWLGQSPYQFNGAVSPLRIAPAFPYLGALLDLATGRALGIFALQNLLLLLVGLAALASAYASLGRLLPRDRWLAAGLALLLVACPGVLGLAYNKDFFMSWTALPWVPWVWYATVRSFRDGGSAGSLALLGVSLGLCWWSHSPIAFWLTLAAGTAQLVRLVRQPPRGAGWRRPALGAAAFLAVAAYPIGSVLLYPPAAGGNASSGMGASSGVVVYFIQLSGWRMLAPLSALGGAAGDFQLGYGLWAVLGLAALAPGWRRPLEARVLLAVAGLLLLLLLPVPGLDRLLWTAVPETLRNITGSWVAPRFYLLVAGAIAYAAAAALSQAPGPSTWARAVVAAGCVWSLAEAAKFTRGSIEHPPEARTADDFLRPENVYLSRYSYVFFPRLPAYFTHGATEPALENRLWTELGGPLQADDFAAARATGTVLARIRLVPVPRSAGLYLRGTAPLPLRPGHHYLLAFDFGAAGQTRGVLQLIGTGLEREYELPNSGEPAAFGAGGRHSSLLALQTSEPGGEDAVVRFVPAAPSLDGLGDYARVTLLEYDSARLPVQVTSWLPYRASVRAAGPAWLETPRMYQRGYHAEVNGAPAELARSPEGLAAVRVPAGASEVVLRFRPPAGLAFLFGLSLAAIAAAAGFGLRAVGRPLVSRG